MNDTLLLLPILIPLVAGIIVLVLPKSLAGLRTPLALLATLANLGVAILLFQTSRTPDAASMHLSNDWAGFGLAFMLRLTPFNAFILMSAAAFGLLVLLFSGRFMQGSQHVNQFFAYVLFTLAQAAGAVLADHLITLLFFWEGLLLTLFGMIAIGGRPGSWKTALKALIIVGIADLCMMVGIAITGWQAGTLVISQIHLDVHGVNALAMVLLIIGAISKGGSMPFHSWIPDAATDAPLPFMALIPAAMEKLLGIYLLSRICLDMFHLTPDCWVSTLLMVVGAATILLAVGMALVQKDYKRLLSYHAISQVGYMILGIGTATVFGVVGGLFHMINNALYKSLLFLTAGSVEKQTGTTDLAKLGGIGRLMPITFTCFIIAALSISGFPLTNGFFSKELIYEGAMERNVLYYVAAVLGSFLTAASFLKLGHAAFLGKRAENAAGAEGGTGGLSASGVGPAPVREVPLTMLAPMVLLAAGCLAFAYNPLPIEQLLKPAVAGTHFVAENPLAEEHLAGWPTNMFLTVMTIAVLAAALVNHLVGVKRTGRGLGAVDHIHYAPVFHTLYNKAEQRWFDPYDQFMKLANGFARVGWAADRFIDWIYEGLAVGVTRGLTGTIRLAHTGSYSLYVVWALASAAVVMYFLVRS